jgi:hypothetical protein
MAIRPTAALVLASLLAAPSAALPPPGSPARPYSEVLRELTAAVERALMREAEEKAGALLEEALDSADAKLEELKEGAQAAAEAATDAATRAPLAAARALGEDASGMAATSRDLNARKVARGVVDAGLEHGFVEGRYTIWSGSVSKDTLEVKLQAPNPGGKLLGKAGEKVARKLRLEKLGKLREWVQDATGVDVSGKLPALAYSVNTKGRFGVVTSFASIQGSKGGQSVSVEPIYAQEFEYQRPEQLRRLLGFDGEGIPGVRAAKAVSRRLFEMMGRDASLLEPPRPVHAPPSAPAATPGGGSALTRAFRSAVGQLHETLDPPQARAVADYDVTAGGPGVRVAISRKIAPEHAKELLKRIEHLPGVAQLSADKLAALVNALEVEVQVEVVRATERDRDPSTPDRSYLSRKVSVKLKADILDELGGGGAMGLAFPVPEDAEVGDVVLDGVSEALGSSHAASAFAQVVTRTAATVTRIAEAPDPVRTITREALPLAEPTLAPPAPVLRARILLNETRALRQADATLTELARRMPKGRAVPVRVLMERRPVVRAPAPRPAPSMSFVVAAAPAAVPLPVPESDDTAAYDVVDYTVTGTGEAEEAGEPSWELRPEPQEPEARAEELRRWNDHLVQHQEHQLRGALEAQPAAEPTAPPVPPSVAVEDQGPVMEIPPGVFARHAHNPALPDISKYRRELEQMGFAVPPPAVRAKPNAPIPAGPVRVDAAGLQLAAAAPGTGAPPMLVENQPEGLPQPGGILLGGAELERTVGKLAIRRVRIDEASGQALVEGAWAQDGVDLDLLATALRLVLETEEVPFFSLDPEEKVLPEQIAQEEAHRKGLSRWLFEELPENARAFEHFRRVSYEVPDENGAVFRVAAIQDLAEYLPEDLHGFTHRRDKLVFRPEDLEVGDGRRWYQTRFGEILYEADRALKELWSGVTYNGKDPSRLLEVSGGIRPRIWTGAEEDDTRWDGHRFWFVPSGMARAGRQLLDLRDVRPRLRIRGQLGTEDIISGGEDEATPGALVAARLGGSLLEARDPSLTDWHHRTIEALWRDFDRYAEVLPSWGELREVFRAYVLARWLKERCPGFGEALLDELPVPRPNVSHLPGSTPMPRLFYARFDAQGKLDEDSIREMVYAGGVSLKLGLLEGLAETSLRTLVGLASAWAVDPPPGAPPRTEAMQVRGAQVQLRLDLPCGEDAAGLAGAAALGLDGTLRGVGASPEEYARYREGVSTAGSAPWSRLTDRVGWVPLLFCLGLALAFACFMRALEAGALRPRGLLGWGIWLGDSALFLLAALAAELTLPRVEAPWIGTKETFGLFFLGVGLVGIMDAFPGKPRLAAGATILGVVAAASVAPSPWRLLLLGYGVAVVLLVLSLLGRPLATGFEGMVARARGSRPWYSGMRAALALLGAAALLAPTGILEGFLAVWTQAPPELPLLPTAPLRPLPTETLLPLLAQVEGVHSWSQVDVRLGLLLPLVVAGLLGTALRSLEVLVLPRSAPEAPAPGED